MRFDPFRELDRLSQPVTNRPMPSLAMDAWRHDHHFEVRIDLPGIDPDSVDLTVEKQVLTIRATRSWKPAEGDEVVVSERQHGTFTRQLFLGEGLDTERIQARYEHGVLMLTIPVAEQAKPRKVQVVTAAEQGNGSNHSEPRVIEATTTAA